MSEIKVRCSYSSIVEVKGLKPHPDNPNTHPKRQIELLAKNIRELGWRHPITVSRRSGYVVAGHGRLLAAIELNLSDVPVDLQEFESIEEERIALIADNRLAELSEIDEEILARLASSFAPDVVPELLGYSPVEWAEIAAQEIDAQAVAFDADQVVPEIRKVIDHDYTFAEIVALLINPAEAMMQFNQIASGSRAKTGGWISLLFNPHRLSVSQRSSPTFWPGVVTNADFIKRRARFLFEQCHGKRLSEWPRLCAVGLAGIQLAGDFPPSQARWIYDRYCKKGARVLDPCHGWGGRVIGFMSLLSSGMHYVGFDPSAKTNAGVSSLIDFLSKSKSQQTAEVHRLPFEEAKLKESSFHFAFTSPPYFDTEDYDPGSALQSSARHTSFEKWRDNWYHPFLDKTIRSLKKGSNFVLNVGNQKYPLDAVALTWARDAGHKARVIYDSEINFTKAGMGERESSDDPDEHGEMMIEITR